MPTFFYFNMEGKGANMPGIFLPVTPLLPAHFVQTGGDRFC